MRKVKNVFEPKASRILRCFLSNPGKTWSIREIANEVDVSVGYTHAVTTTLLEMDYIIRNNRDRLEMVNPIRLLERWANFYQYNYENKFIEYYTFDREIDLIINKFKNISLEYALTTLSGAYLISPYVRPTVLEFYVKNNRIGQDIVSDLNFIPTQKNGNVRVVIPYDRGVFYKTQDFDNINIVSNVQLYVDLINYPSRGEEAAKNIYKKIKRAWTDYLFKGQEDV
jgi:hypothetical protein